MVRAQQVVTRSVLAMALLFGCNLVAQEPDRESTSPAGPATAPADNDARSLALQRTGLLPYRVDPADVLSVQFDAETGSVQAELTVGPTGTITIQDIGEFSVAGKTLEEILTAVQRSVENLPRFHNLRVQVLRSESKCLYICYLRSDGSKETHRVPCTADTELNTLLSTMSWPTPISDEVQITRSIEATESTYCVHWLNGEAVYLLPGDRVFVKPAGNADGTSRNNPVVSPPNSRSVVDREVTLNAKLIVDPQGTLVEYNSVTKGESLQAEAAATMAMLRILNKNRLIQLTALPSVTCRTGTTVNLVTEDEFTVTICPTVNEAGTISMTAKCTFEHGDVQMALIASDGKTLIVPLQDEFDASPDSPNEAHCALFLAITPTLAR